MASVIFSVTLSNLWETNIWGHRQTLQMSPGSALLHIGCLSLLLPLFLLMQVAHLQRLVRHSVVGYQCGTVYGCQIRYRPGPLWPHSSLPPAAKNFMKLNINPSSILPLKKLTVISFQMQSAHFPLTQHSVQGWNYHVKGCWSNSACTPASLHSARMEILISHMR